MARKLSPKQKLFVAEYLVDLNATQACIRAGYSAKTADRIGPELLGKTCVSAAIAEQMQAREERTLITADYVLTTIRDTVERCRQGEAVIDKEGKPTGEWRFDATNVLKGCELLGKHINLFEKHQQSKSQNLADALQQAFGFGTITLPSQDLANKP